MLLSITLYGKIKVLSLNHTKQKAHNINNSKNKKTTTHCKSSLAFRENEPTAVMASENPKKCIWMLVCWEEVFSFTRLSHCTFYGCWIQTEGLKLLLPQRHAFHLAEVVEQSLRAAAAAEQEEEALVARSQLTGSVKKSKGWIPLQVADDQLLDAGVGRLDGLAELFQTLRVEDTVFHSWIPLLEYCCTVMYSG